jgi:hypothetical protein
MKKSDQEKTDELFTHMLNKTIVGVGVVDDEIELTLSDNTFISIYSDDSLGIYYELPPKAN